MKPSEEEIRKSIETICFAGFYDIRSILPGKGAVSHIFQYPDDLDKMTSCAINENNRGRNVYITLNPASSELADRFQKEGGGARDDDIICRRWLPVDIDSVRLDEHGEKLKDCSATEAELDACWPIVQDVASGLKCHGFCDPIVAASGNGFHLLYPIELPNDETSGDLIRRLLAWIAEKNNTDRVEIDTRVYNASRIFPVYGTFKRKGEDTPDRPWRPTAITYSGVSFLDDETNNNALVRVSEKLAWIANRKEELYHLQKNGERPSARERAIEYLKKVPPAISGQGGHSALFTAARDVVWGFDIGQDEAFDILKEHYNPICQPPWSDRDLRYKVKEADTKPFDKPRGYLLNEDREPAAALTTRSTSRQAGEGRTGEAGDPILDTSFTLAELLRMEIPPATWIVEGLIQSTGMSSIAGRPKLGKSWLTLQLAICVASGISYLGRSTSANEKGTRVLILALEDNKRRFKKRSKKLLSGLELSEQGWPSNLVIVLDSHGKDASGKAISGIDWLAFLIEKHKPGLVIVDTMGRLFPSRPGKGKSGYLEDYAQGALMHELATSHGIALVTTTHTNKRDIDETDHLDATQGTTGATSAQDTVMTFTRVRGSNEGRLRVTSRDLDSDLDLALEFDPDKGPWQFKGLVQSEPNDKQKAAEWLKRFLEDGEKPSGDCMEAGNVFLGHKRGVDWWRDDVYRELCNGMKPYKKNGRWYWKLSCVADERTAARTAADRPDNCEVF